MNNERTLEKKCNYIKNLRNIQYCNLGDIKSEVHCEYQSRDIITYKNKDGEIIQKYYCDYGK